MGERKELDKLKEDVIARKKDLKAEGMTGGQMNKDAQIVAWVKRMNELKEKAGELEKKADKEKLKTEFGYTKADINKDEDIIAMTKKLKEMKGLGRAVVNASMRVSQVRCCASTVAG